MNEQFFVATDIDGTVLGDSRSESDFLKWGKNRKNIILAYVTGRSTNSVCRLIEGGSLPAPDFIVGSVGTRMLDMRHGSENFEDEFRRIAPRDFPAKELRQLGQSLGLTLQPEEDLHDHKVSFFHGSGSDLQKVETEARMLADINFIVTESYYVDMLPSVYGKGPAVKFLAEKLGIDMDHLLVAGDTENDADMFNLGSHGVVPLNGVRALDAKVDGKRIVRSEHPYARALLEDFRNKGLR